MRVRPRTEKAAGLCGGAVLKQPCGGKGGGAGAGSCVEKAAYGKDGGPCGYGGVC